MDGRSGVDDHHLAAGLIRFHDAMRFADLLKAEDPCWLRLETPPVTYSAIFWSGTSDSGNCGVPKTKLPKKVR